MANDLLLEIGTEELPASFVQPALDQLKELFVTKARDARLGHGEVHVYGTPRRLALLVDGVEEGQADLTEEILGPPVRVAYDAEGKPTQVAEKWAAGQKIPVANLKQKETPKGLYVYLERMEKGQAAAEVLPGLLASILKDLHFKKSMRWGWEEATFARPVQWICALLGEKTLEFGFADVKSGNVTHGHRFLAKKPIELEAPGQYLARLEEGHVIVDQARRQAMIKEVVAAEAATIGGRVLDDAELLETVTFLVENPSAVLGSFDADYLALPPEVLVSEAKGHQKYVSVVDAAGMLLPTFVAVSNTPVKD
jgi:glycyl-tRNA synthetase beta chain